MQNLDLTGAPLLDWTEIERHSRTANNLIVALDEHRAALEWALCSGDEKARSQLQHAENALDAARAAFRNVSRELAGDASQTLRDLEIAWQSRLLHAHPAIP